jgi:hypothetical protein
MIVSSLVVPITIVLMHTIRYFIDSREEPKILTIKQQRLKKLKKLNRFRLLKISI